MLCHLYRKIVNYFKTKDKIVEETIHKLVDKVIKKIQEMESVLEYSDASLQIKTIEFKKRIQDKEMSLSNTEDFLLSIDNNSLIIDAMAVFSISVKNILGITPYKVQIFAAFLLLGRNVGEMKTGEGKTLAIAISAYVHGLFKSTHIITANDYLVKRDAAEMGKVFKFLGMSVGVIDSNLPPTELKKIYAKDIVYGTGSSFVFSFLRNRLITQKDDLYINEIVSKNLDEKTFPFVIIDEIDSILIDEARTPLIISSSKKSDIRMFALAEELIGILSEDQIEIKLKENNVLLKDNGITDIEDKLKKDGYLNSNESIMDSSHISLMHYTSNALRAKYVFAEGKDYMINNNKLLLIDNITGRVLEGRSYSGGLHQAIQAKHGLDLDDMTETLSSMTYDYYFAKYEKIAGTSGTALIEKKEFESIYNLDVFNIPTKEKNIRKDHDDIIYCTAKERDKYIIERVKKTHESGRPVLLYTLSEVDSNIYSSLLKRFKIKHQVLNAKNNEREAYIIAQAGRYGRVTVVTSIAGRGTDILLGGNPEMLAKQSGIDMNSDSYIALTQECAKEKELVMELGGLAIISAGRNDSRRLDDQMRGRAGRQGEPGSSVVYISLTDSLFSYMGKDNIDKMQSMMRWAGLKDGEAIEDSYINSAILQAQKSKETAISQSRADSRKFMNITLLQSDKIFEMRMQILFEDNIYDVLKFNIKEEIDYILQQYINTSTNELDNLDQMIEYFANDFDITIDKNDIENKTIDYIKISLVNILLEKISLVKDMLNKDFNKIIKHNYIKVIDFLWVKHINELEYLKQIVFLRAYGQKDIEVEYSREAYNLFSYMLNDIRYTLITNILKKLKE